MEIKKEIQITLSVDDIKQIIIEFINKEQSVNVKHINFNVNANYNDLGTNYELTDIYITGTEKS